MAQYTFGTGRLVLTPSGANPTPVQVGVLQEVSFDVSQDVKELYGDQTFAVDAALGPAKISGKIKTGQVFSQVLAAALGPAAAVTTGHQFGVIDVAALVAAGAFDTGFVKANFVEDLGAFDDTGLPLTRVASAPTASQYAIDQSGANTIYTFNVANNGKTFSVSYVKLDSATGKTVTLNNSTMGANPIYFQLGLWNPGSRGKDAGLRLNRVLIPKLGLPFKNTDFLIKDLDFTGFADASKQVARTYTIE